MNLANWLTTLRIILAPICVGILFWDIPERYLLATIIFVIASITDGLDGYVARVRKEITAFGKSYDPLADKVLIILTLIVLTRLNLVHWVALAIIILREVLITVLRHFAGKKGLAIAASPWGKMKTVCQIIAITMILMSKYWPALILISGWVLWAAVALTVWSGIDYVWHWRSAFTDLKSNEQIQVGE